MKVLLMYDINTKTAEGKRRLVKIASVCLNHGVRIQDSVYECELDAKQLRSLISKLELLMDPQRDSIRFYNLGKHYEARTTVIGKALKTPPENFII